MTGTEQIARGEQIARVLRAIDRYAFAPLMLPEHSRQIAGPTHLLKAGAELSDDEQAVVLRVLHGAADRISAPLASVGLELPPLTEPVRHADTQATRHLEDVYAVMGAEGRILVQCPEHLIEMVRSLPGTSPVRDSVRTAGVQAGKMRVHPTHSMPSTPAAAGALVSTFEALCRVRMSPQVRRLAETFARQAVVRSLTDESTPLPADTPDGTDEVRMKLWGHQQRMVALGENADAVLAAVPMGGGKTAGAIAIVNRTGAHTVLIGCPNSVRRVWPREVREKSVVSWHIEDGTRAPMRRGARRQNLSQPERVSRAQFLWFDCRCGAPVHAFVTNYESLNERCWQDLVPQQKLDMIIWDEAHNLKGTGLKPNRAGKAKGRHERKLGPKATEEQRAAARRLDAIGPAERALPADATNAQRVKAQAEDMLAEKAAELERGKKLSQSGMAARLVDLSHKRLGLTGTPFAQHPWDIFGILRALDPGIFGMEFEGFRDEFLVMDRTNKFPVKIKKEMMGEFARKCMSIMYRPVVDLDLPGCADSERYVTLEPDARRAYDQFHEELFVDLRRFMLRDDPEALAAYEASLGSLRSLAGDGGGDDPDLAAGTEFGSTDGLDDETELTAKNLLTRILRLQQLTGGTLRTDPGTAEDGALIPGVPVRVSRAKADALASLTKNRKPAPGFGRRGQRIVPDITHEITGGVLAEVGCVPGRPDGKGGVLEPEPVVVYCRFRSDLDAVAEIAARTGLRYGEISGRRGDGLNADARMADDVDLLGVQIQAGGTGIDLTRSCVGVWYSLGYSVSDYDQARARQYRPGQTRPVRYVHLLAEDTQDDAVYEAIADRRDAVGEVMLAGGIVPEKVGYRPSPPGAAQGQSRLKGQDDARVAVPVPWEKSRT